MAVAKTTAALFIGPDRALRKGTTTVKLKVPDSASDALASSPERISSLLRGYGEAFARSRAAGRPISFRVEVDPEGEMVVTPLDDAAASAGSAIAGEATPDPELEAALADARQRGRLRAAEILSAGDMVSADAFAKILGTTRVTVNAKRQSGQVLGLDGAKRGFRFPIWQLDAEGKPYGELAALHEQLGGPWAVYRFLVQPHGALGGLTGREALEQGRTRAALEAAEGVGRDFG